MLKSKVAIVSSSEAPSLSDDEKRILNAQKNDALDRLTVPDGALNINPHIPDSTDQLALADSIMRHDADILRVLAK